jgi:hypothetical protein
MAELAAGGPTRTLTFFTNISVNEPAAKLSVPERIATAKELD